MKLQIEGQSLRVRIGESELAQLLAGQAVELRTRFALAFTIVCTLRLAPIGEAGFTGQPEAWLIELPDAAVREHASRLPTREGLTFALPTTESGEVLELLFDVDVRDSVRQRRSS
ncbi:hypothetical protein DVT68_13675 [Dyella solisilvae]|uniref:Uncharacterized protein n=1 Tax=Dyella solisilvae TaxID=1920168 RepID=A0A370K6N9_9GAMM|nr:hypothetical protein [Dyella solisilvae]RDI98127.1 hypothetical protein DVT68_13675 [Dyella solisilvae]